MLTANHHVPDFIARRRWWVLPLLAWAAVIGVSLVSHFKELEAHSREVAVAGARDMFRMVVLIRAWNAEHGGFTCRSATRCSRIPILSILAGILSHGTAAP